MLQGLPKNFVFHPDRRGSAGRTASSISTVVGADLNSSRQRSCFYRQIYFCRKSTTEASICNRAVWARQEVGQRSGIVHPVDFQNKTVSTLQHNKVRHLNDKQTNNKTIQLHSYWPTVEALRSERNDEITQSERLDDIRQTWRSWNQIWDMTLRWGRNKTETGPVDSRGGRWYLTRKTVWMILWEILCWRMSWKSKPRDDWL